MMNDPATLARARLQIHAIASALNDKHVHFHWIFAQGDFPALYQEQLIDLTVKRRFEAEADCARQSWRESGALESEPSERFPDWPPGGF